MDKLQLKASPYFAIEDKDKGTRKAESKSFIVMVNTKETDPEKRAETMLHVFGYSEYFLLDTFTGYDPRTGKPRQLWDYQKKQGYGKPSYVLTDDNGQQIIGILCSNFRTIKTEKGKVTVDQLKAVKTLISKINSGKIGFNTDTYQSAYVKHVKHMENVAKRTVGKKSGKAVKVQTGPQNTALFNSVINKAEAAMKKYGDWAEFPASVITALNNFAEKAGYKLKDVRAVVEL